MKKATWLLLTSLLILSSCGTTPVPVNFDLKWELCKGNNPDNKLWICLSPEEALKFNKKRILHCSEK